MTQNTLRRYGVQPTHRATRVGCNDCLEPLNFGVVCCAAKENQNRFMKKGADGQGEVQSTREILVLKRESLVLNRATSIF
jgi:hypothetical protein